MQLMSYPVTAWPFIVKFCGHHLLNYRMDIYTIAFRFEYNSALANIRELYVHCFQRLADIFFVCFSICVSVQSSNSLSLSVALSMSFRFICKATKGLERTGEMAFMNQMPRQRNSITSPIGFVSSFGLFRSISRCWPERVLRLGMEIQTTLEPRQRSVLDSLSERQSPHNTRP